MIYHQHSSYKPDCMYMQQQVFCRREVQFKNTNYNVYTISVLQKYKARRRDKNIFQRKTQDELKKTKGKSTTNTQTQSGRRLAPPRWGLFLFY